jgi:hypothetical protein
MARQTSTARLSLGQDLRDALDKAPDYSRAFTNRVAELAQKLEKQLHVPVEHKPDLNESVAQLIAIWFNQHYRPIPPREDHAKWRLNTHISSKGPFFAFVVLTLSSDDWKNIGLPEPQLYWAPVHYAKVPDTLKSFEKRIALVLNGEHFQRVEDSVLTQEVGRKTELGEPATVFDAIFGEPC